MKFFPLLLANLGRHKRRTILTMLSVALAMFLFASLRTVVTTLQKTGEFGGANRLVSMSASGFMVQLPVSYANRLQAIPGVEKVTWANWFGGRYGDGKRFFAHPDGCDHWHHSAPEQVVDDARSHFRDAADSA
jgi:putative ABC transport system permease protein